MGNQKQDTEYSLQMARDQMSKMLLHSLTRRCYRFSRTQELQRDGKKMHLQIINMKKDVVRFAITVLTHSSDLALNPSASQDTFSTSCHKASLDAESDWKLDFIAQCVAMVPTSAPYRFWSWGPWIWTWFCIRLTASSAKRGWRLLMIAPLHWR